MKTKEKFDKAIAHIEKLCGRYYELTGQKLTNEEDSRIHVTHSGIWFDGDFLSKVVGEAEQNYGLRWARKYEAFFIDAVREAELINKDDSDWVQAL